MSSSGICKKFSIVTTGAVLLSLGVGGTAQATILYGAGNPSPEAIVNNIDLGLTNAVNTATGVNRGFETGNFSGWTVVDQVGGSGSWFVTDRPNSPWSGFSIPPASEGDFLSVTDQTGPGSHVLFQDIFLEAGYTHELSFDWFAQNTSRTGLIDAGTMSAFGARNQHFRVDLVPTTFFDWFGPSSSAGILANILAPVAEPNPVSGFNSSTFDLTPWAGSTVRLAFREVDNRSFFHAGVDNVRITSESVPEPSATLGLLAFGAFGAGAMLKRKRERQGN